MKELDFAKNDSEMTQLMNTVKALRSQVASYKIQGNVKPTVIVQTNNAQTLAVFKQEVAVINSLAKAGETMVIAHTDAVPAGCLKGFVSEEISIFVKVVGLIDLKSETDRIGKRMKQLEDFKAGITKKMSIPDYEKKVPENVRKDNNDKMQTYDNELAELTKQMNELKQLQ